MSKKGKLEIEGIRFDIIKLGETYKHELSKSERDRRMELGDCHQPEDLPIEDLKTDSSGNILSKPHTEPGKMHVDLTDGNGNVIKDNNDSSVTLRREDMETTTTVYLSGSSTRRLSYPQNATTHTVGVYGTDFPDTVNTSIDDGNLVIDATPSGTLNVAFW